MIDRFDQLPYSIRCAAMKALGDPGESGAEHNPDEVVRQYNDTQTRQAQFGGEVMKISTPASTAPDAEEHSSNGAYPDTQPPYIR